MTVTFIAHSAYLVEWDKFYTLFDYTYEPDYTGELPELNPDKPLLVFASHSHEDHFDAKVFTLLEKYPDARFFVSRDTRLTERKRQWLNISDEALHAIARKTIERKTGARGLRSVMENILMPVMYNVPTDPTIIRVTIDEDTVEGGEAHMEYGAVRKRYKNQPSLS